MYSKEDISTFLSDYTMGGRIPFHVRMIEDDNHTNEYKPEQYNENMLKLDLDQPGNYPDVDRHLVKIFNKNPTLIDHRRVLVVGSGNCWYESMCLAYGASRVDVLEIRDIKSGHDKVQYMRSTDRIYDLIVNISTVEHAGLGRYGDELDCDGDLKLMHNLRKNCNQHTVHILSMPCGADAVYYNAHRVYGELRLNKLLEGWEVKSVFNFTEHMLLVNTQDYQPIFVLRKG